MAAKPALSGLANTQLQQMNSRPTKPSWYKEKGYLHFDSPVGWRKAQAIATAPHVVAQHAFYPFISYTVESETVHVAAHNKLATKVKERPVAYASHLDAQIYSYYAQQLQQQYEAYLQQQILAGSVLAFRSLGKSNIEFAKEAFDSIRKQQRCVAIALDITGFFDHLNHVYLKQ